MSKSVLVRFSAPAMSADRLLNALSKQTHISLICAPEVREDVLLLHVNNIPLEKVMSRIAEAAGARWQKIGNGWRLERPVSLAMAQHERDIQTRAAIIAPNLREILSPLQKPWNEAVLRKAASQWKQITSTGHMYPEAEHLDPIYRAFLRCLSDISPEAIARIPVGSRVVFATAPTPMQQPLGKGALLAMDLLNKEQLVFGATLRQVGINGMPIDVPVMLWDYLEPYRITPTRALLILEREDHTVFRGKLILLGKKGEEAVEYNIIQIGALSFTPARKIKPSTKLSPKIVYSAQTRVLSNIHFTLDDRRKPSAQALRLLSMPEQYDPLSAIVSDSYLTLARVKKRNLIAALPDFLVERFDEIKDQKTVDDVINGPKYYPAPMRIVDRDGWLVVMPPYPYEARQERINRAMLGKIVRRIVQHGRCSIEDMTEYRTSSNILPFNEAGEQYLWAVSPADQLPQTSGSVGLTALYGSLTTSQKKALLAGKPLLYGRLTPRQRYFAEQAVFGVKYSFSPSNNPAGEKKQPLPPLPEEPTEGYPQGLPADGELNVSRKREKYFLFCAPDKAKKEQIYWRMEEHGTVGFGGQPPSLPPGGIASFRYDIRYRETLTVEVDITPWRRMSATYTEGLSPRTAPPVPFAQLPPDVQKLVEKDLAFIQRIAIPPVE
ncbi:MAG: hypothetical protein QM758_24150 [Armatimonas sp.]